jgi:starch phosphorylase
MDFTIIRRTLTFAANAALGNSMGKCITHAIAIVAGRINDSNAARDIAKVAFIPNYSVSLVSEIIFAVGGSGEIATVGK